MKKCPNCDRILGDDALICFDCGKLVVTKLGPIDIINLIWGVLGFFLPTIGAILYFVYRKDAAPKANSVGIGVLSGVAARLIIFALLVLL